VADADSGGDPPATDDLGHLRRLFEHGARADGELLDGLRKARRDLEPSRHAWREYAHLLAAQEVWLARLEGRSASVPVWPDLSPEACDALRMEVAEGYARYLGGLTADPLSTEVPYANSAGTAFTTPVGDILLHVALHGQYHRGKVNLLLRQAGEAPVPTDYIAFVRGAPAARTEVER